MQSETEAIESSSPSTVRVLLDPAITFSRREIGGRTTYVASQPEIGKFFKFGPEEHRIAELLDGERSITDILQQLDLDGIHWDAKDVADFISKLVAGRLATTVDTSTESPQESKPTEPTSPQPNRSQSNPGWSARLPQFLSLMISQRIPLLDGQAFATKLEKKVGWVFGGKGMLGWLILVASGLIIVYGNVQDFSAEIRRMFDPGIWLILIAMWCAAKVMHEAGHAVAAKYHDVRVGKIGIMFFFLAPLAYVDVTDAWKLKSRWHRVQIALAGVYVELAVAALAAWVWWLLPDVGIGKHLAAQFFLIAGPATLLVNANPLLRLDGYYVLSDLTETPNLRMHGRKQLAAWFEKLLFRIPTPRPLLGGWRQSFATCHAACSVVFQVVWMGGLIIAVSMWAKGLGVLLGIAAFVLWALLPLSRWVRKIWLLERGEGRLRMNDKRRRMLGYAGLLIMMAQYLCTASSPLDRRVCVIVQFRDEQIARASSDAFVRKVFVSRGQRVAKGTILVELEDPDLQIRRDEKADDLQLAQLKSIQLRRQGELAKAAAEIENAESLRRQLAELDQQLDGLRVVALRNGLVNGSRFENLEGRFVHRGDELLRVSDPQEKELLASVSENDMQAYQEAAARQAPAHVRLRGGTVLRAIPALLRPRARRTLPHPALSASVGGPLAVEPSPDESEEMRMVLPHLKSVTRLDPLTSVEVRAGQLGTMTISDNRSFVARLLDATAGSAQHR